MQEGQTVQVKDNINPDDLCYGKHPTEDRYLVAGDKLVIKHVIPNFYNPTFNKGTTFAAIAYSMIQAVGEIWDYSSTTCYQGVNIIPQNCVELVKDNLTCTCQIWDLMIRGCKCGAIEHERRTSCS